MSVKKEIIKALFWLDRPATSREIAAEIGVDVKQVGARLGQLRRFGYIRRIDEIHGKIIVYKYELTEHERQYAQKLVTGENDPDVDDFLRSIEEASKVKKDVLESYFLNTLRKLLGEALKRGIVTEEMTVGELIQE